MDKTTKELVPLQKKVSTLALEVEKIEIKGAEDMKRATVVLSTMNAYADSVKEKKETLTKPINTALKNIRAMFKPLEETYEGAIETLRTKMGRYQTEEVRRVREEEAKIANRVGDGKGKLKIETAINQIEAIEKPNKEVSSDVGLVQFREVKRWRVMDITLVPLEYMIVDEKKVNEAMKNGIQIGGLDYYTEQVPVNYR